MSGSVDRDGRRAVLRTALVGALILFALTVLRAGPAAADGTGWPSHSLGQVSCSAGQVAAYPPAQMSPVTPTNFTRPEEVGWSPNLYVYNSATAQWTLYDSSKPYYRAFTSSYGYFQAQLHQPWTTPTANDIVFSLFSGLAPGYYAVWHVLVWRSTGAEHTMWSPYCQVP